MLRYLENVVTLQLDIETCNGCGMCVTVCPHEVFDIQGRKAVIIDRNACIECGACAINCPVNAIRVQTGAGCATGILFGAIGKSNECSCGCGVSPVVTESTQTDCSGTPIENTNTDNNKPSCCS
ncbi:Ferredoxin-type protein NapF [subsurface metagenome]